MATISQQPAALALVGAIGNPFNLLVDVVSFTNTSGSVAWSAVTAPAVIVQDGYGNAIAGSTPQITNPAEDYQLYIQWTSAQTVQISNCQNARWSLEITVNGVGPLAILAGPLTFVPPTWPGSSTPQTASLSVQVGTVTADLSISSATSSPIILNLDGGTASSAYLSTQIIDGGNA